ncbi:hypothetical protein [Klebsiella quasipneumoniae]|uniref:hypothetical protein n=1 Tax=Klebsiella quasipneumoniae TaxID=1463165 RepID=UPI002D7FA02A|nr:hypothetical protein [Klebsiella quasipneumoniae]MEB4701068.1 hypothetical protein [Klebsiella quasipneumoniae]
MAFNPPLGSASPEVLIDNATRLDKLANGPAATIPDRAGEPLDSWRQMMAKNEATRQNLIPLGKQYTTLAEAQADIANIPPGSTTYYRSPDDSALAIEVMNVAGTLQPTGRAMVSKVYVDEIKNRIPNIDMSSYWGGIIAADGAIGVVFSKSDNRPIFGHGGDLIAKLAQLMSESGKITVYQTLAEGMANQSVGDSFVVAMNGQDNLLTPCVFKKETDKMASPVFGITTDKEVIHMSKSGYWGGIISGSNQIGIAFRDTDNRAILGNGGDIVSRIEALEQDSKDITTASDAYGDSLVAGTGGTPFPLQLAELIGNGFVSSNYGIGGQRSGQIAMRMGAKPTYLTLSGDAVPANGQSVSITQINGVSATAAPAYPFMDVRLLSTNSSNTTNTLDGLICGVKCRITRTASGANTDAKIEVYTLTALEGAGVRCLPGSLFTPLYAMQDRSASEMWICAGINDFRSGATSSADYDNDVSAIKENIDAMVNFAERSGRKVLIFGLTNGNYAVEFKDGIRYPKILEVNYYLSQKYPGYYVRSDSALDVREKVVASYDSSLSQDVIDFGNDITPSSLRSDNRHPNTAGYAIYAALGYQFRQRKGF